MKMKKLAVAFPFLAFAAVACTNDASWEAAGSSDDAIVGGKKVASSDPIAHTAVSVLDASGEQFCTGIVVAEDVVLTAAHCFDDASRVPSVRIGSAAPARVIALGVHAQYSKTRRTKYDATIEKAATPDDIITPATPLNDLALLALETPLANATPATFAAASSIGADGVTTAGFGCTTTICKGQSDVLRKVDLDVVRFAPEANLVVLSAGAKHGSCFGDSGGPDFVSTASGLRVVAMVSTGPESCEAGLSVDTLVAPFSSWIKASTAPLRAARVSSSYKLVRF